jgi:hypothetical protein
MLDIMETGGGVGGGQVTNLMEAVEIFLLCWEHRLFSHKQAHFGFVGRNFQCHCKILALLSSDNKLDFFNLKIFEIFF